MSDYAEFDPNSEHVINREEIAHELTDDVRSLARRVALQVLYQIDSSHHTISDVLRYHLITDDISGKIVDLDYDIASLITGRVRTLAADHPIAQRLHHYHQVYDAQTGKMRDRYSDLMQRTSTIIKYLEAEPDIRHLAASVQAHQPALDRVLAHYAPEFPIAQVAIIDRNILRIALYELAFQPELPPSVVIDEAVAMAQLFGAEGAARFVNGVLGTIIDKIDSVRAALDAAPHVPHADE